MLKLNKDWKFKTFAPQIGAYVTAFNCVRNNYPIIGAIKSFSWCDEIVVIDGGSDDSTMEELEKLKETIPQLQVYQIPIDMDMPGKDGAQKAMARSMCQSPILIQFDADEFCIGEVDQWKDLARNMSTDILQLPVIEPLGSLTSLRLNKSHNPIKWRLFKNKPEITHGIPKSDRIEKDGQVFSKGMSDGCFPIHIVSENQYPSNLVSYASKMRYLFHKGDVDKYKEFVEEILESKSPAVLHVGHVDLEKKIQLFLNEWRKWWACLYDKDPQDISMYFEGKTLEEVTVDDVKKRASELASEVPVVEIDRLKEFEGLLNEGHNI